MYQQISFDLIMNQSKSILHTATLCLMHNAFIPCVNSSQCFMHSPHENSSPYCLHSPPVQVQVCVSCTHPHVGSSQCYLHSSPMQVQTCTHPPCSFKPVFPALSPSVGSSLCFLHSPPVLIQLHISCTHPLC